MEYQIVARVTGDENEKTKLTGKSKGKRDAKAIRDFLYENNYEVTITLVKEVIL